MLSANQNAEIFVCILIGIKQASKGQISTMKRHEARVSSIGPLSEQNFFSAYLPGGS